MIKATTDKTLNIILPNTNKALKEVLANSSPKELAGLSAKKDLKSLLENIFSKSAQNPAQDKILLNLVKNNPTLKELGNISSNAKEFLQFSQQDKNLPSSVKQLQNILTSFQDVQDKNIQTKLENSGVFLENKLKNFQTPQEQLKTLTHELSKLLQETKIPNVKLAHSQLQEILVSDLFKNIDTGKLTELTNKMQTVLDRLTQSMDAPLDKSISPNVTLFSKETKNVLQQLQLLNKPENLQTQTKVQELLSNDLKAVLLKAHKETNNSQHPNKQELLKHIDKLTLQVDYHQLVSHLSDASSLYLPYSWDALEGGNLSIKTLKDGKFFTDIELQLKEFGLLKLRLGMFEHKQLNINFTTQNETLKTLLQENMTQLRKQLVNVGVIPKEIRFIETETQTPSYTSSSQELALGFEVKA